MSHEGKPERPVISPDYAGATDLRRITDRDLQEGDLFEVVWTMGGENFSRVARYRYLKLGARHHILNPERQMVADDYLIAEAADGSVESHCMGDVGLHPYFQSEAGDLWNSYNYCRSVANDGPERIAINPTKEG